MLVRKEMPRAFGIPVLRDLLEWHPLRELAPDKGLRFVPAFDVKETLEAFVLKADVPGVAEKDIALSLNGNRLTVAGKRVEEARADPEVDFARERPYGAFLRTFVLPDGLDLENLRAELKAGVLTVTAAKKMEQKPRKVPVKDLEKGTLVKPARA